MRRKELIHAKVVLWLCLTLFWSPSAAWTATLTRGPYLQTGTPTSIIVRWRTDTASDSRVRCGTNAASLIWTNDDTSATTEHIVTVTNLSPDTVHFYSVGSSTEALASGTNYFFRTGPLLGSRRPIRIWVLGDSGVANAFSGPVRDAYYDFAGARYTDLWLMLGDNAYPGNSDATYQQAMFNVYPIMLQHTALWSTIGNQETGSSSTASPSVYLQIFSFPTNAEAGGVASGSERYYSFDYGNVHFICLDSMSSARDEGSPMLTWLQADLAASTNDWLIAFWHHPPYSKGSNDSDSRTEQIQMRTVALPLLEAQGVDLVLSGHSHSYERSYLLDGHYGLSTTFTTNMMKDGGSGRLDDTGPYRKDPLGAAPHQGSVYVVAGSGSSTAGGPLNHPVMYRSLNRLGSLVLDIHANRLDAQFVRENGTVDDHFTIIKGASELRLTSLHLANGVVTMQWTSVADMVYHVEFTTDVTLNDWKDVSGPITATDAVSAWSVAANESTAGFYRIAR